MTWGFESLPAYNIMTDHKLKTWPDPFHAMWEGLKTFELRKDDRGFQVGDTLLLQEWDSSIRRPYTGAWIRATVIFILQSGPFPGLESGHVIMSILITGKGRAMCCK